MTEGYFPGSRQPITPVAGAKDILAGRKGKEFTIGGKPVELFTISQLAYFLNRKPVTIRKWEEKGVVPPATFAKPGAGGDPRGRRRLYSRAQVEAMVTIAEAEGILNNPHAQIGQTQFKAKVWAEFKRLAAQR
jgi:hypothetical protein